MRRRKTAVKFSAFVLILALMFGYFSRMLVPEFFYDQIWCTTATYQGFYELEKNSVDVIFLGSSAGATAFVPQELYNNYGIASYNLCCEQQSIFTSYYWLKEAMRFQKPKVAVLETSMLFDRYNDEVLNSTEGCIHKAFDSMKMSPVKYEAVKKICELDDTQYFQGYVLPVMRFHKRWAEMSRKDFREYYEKMSTYHELRGWTPSSSYVSGKINYAPFTADSVTGSNAEPNALMLEYFDKIRDLCVENNIILLLAEIPTTRHTLEKHNTLQDYAYKNRLDFVDFNEKSLYEDLSYDFAVDNSDEAHISYKGSTKITNYIGRILSDKYGLQARTDEILESSRDCYNHVIVGCDLTHVNDVNEYLDKLKLIKDKYDIFISVKDEATQNLREDTVRRLKELGLNADLQGKYRYSYVGIISKGKVIEECKNEKIQVNGCITDSKTTYFVISGGLNNGNISQIKINNIQASKNIRGLNIVVYDDERERIIDKVAFDTWAEDNKIYR